MVHILLCALLWRGLHRSHRVAGFSVWHLLLVNDVDSHRTLQTPLRLYHTLRAVHDAQQLRTLHRAHDRVYLRLSVAQVYRTARVEHLLPCPHCHLCRFGVVVGGAAQDTTYTVVCVWDRETHPRIELTLYFSEPSEPSEPSEFSEYSDNSELNEKLKKTINL